MELWELAAILDIERAKPEEEQDSQLIAELEKLTEGYDPICI